MPASTPSYPTVDAFYAGDRRRLLSPEIDYGVWWRHRGVVYRLTWVEATGELIAVQLGAPQTRIFHDPDKLWPIGAVIIGGDPGSVYLLARVASRDELERRLDGWAEVCGGEGSLAWALERLEGAPA